MSTRLAEIKDALSKPNISFQSRAQLTLEYHDIQQGIHGIPDPVEKKKGWTVKDSAAELGVSPATVVQDFKIARALKDDPKRFDGFTSRNKALEACDTSPALRVELKTARIPLAASVIKVLQIDGHEFFYVKLDKPLLHQHFDVTHLMLPRWQVRIVRYGDDR